MKQLLQNLRLALGVGLTGLAACQEHGRALAAADPIATRQPTPAPTAQLVAQQLGKSDFWISLPPDYRLKTTDGPDFLVYYFAPADTTGRTSFTGGLYLGGHPQGADSAGPGCQQRQAPVVVLGHPASFVVRRCATGYTVNAVFASQSGQPWNPLINAFGEAKSAAELRQLLAVFATLRRQPAPASGR